MTGPLFSIVSAAYNQGLYLDAMLQSVEAQTSRDCELIIVDDGSTDDTAIRLRAWAERHAGDLSRVIIMRTPNRGQSAALEHGCRLAQGRYVCLLDADDRFLPEKLERLRVAIAETPAAGMFIHPMYVVDEDGRRTGELRPKAARLLEGDLRPQVQRDARTTVPGTSAITLRADVLRAILPMPTRAFKTMADAYLPLAASLLAPVRVIREPLAEYRMHADGAHLASLQSAEGLQRWVDVQAVIARHLGLEDAMRRNVTFARNTFALAKLTDTWRAALRAYLGLLRVTLVDAAMPPFHRVLLAGCWTVMAGAPRRLFVPLWTWYLRVVTGWSRLQSASPLPAHL